MKKLSLAFANFLLLLFPFGIQSSRDTTMRLSDSMEIALAPSADVPVPADSTTDQLADYDPLTRLTLKVMPDNSLQAFDVDGNRRWSFQTETRRLLGEREVEVSGLSDEEGRMLKTVIADSPRMTAEHILLGSSVTTVYALDPTNGSQLAKFDLNGSTHSSINSPIDPLVFKVTLHSVQGFNITSGAADFEVQFREYDVVDLYPSLVDALNSPKSHDNTLPPKPRHTFEGSRFTPLCTRPILYPGPYQLADDFLDNINQTLVSAAQAQGLPPGTQVPGFIRTLPGNSVLVNDQAGQAPRSFMVWWIGGLVFVCAALGTFFHFLRRKREVKATEQEQVPVKKNRRRRKARAVEETAGKVEQDRVSIKERINLVLSDRLIGYGSHGTRILEGLLEGRPVAVKCVLAAFYDQAAKEISALIELDHHPNILRYYAMELNDQFVHIALERCSFNLENFILVHSTGSDKRTEVNEFEKAELEVVLEENILLWSGDGYPTPMLLKLLRDIVHGLVHLHELGYVHRDLKPQNVLIRRNGKGLLAKLSDMGISKRLKDGSSSFGTTRTLTGIGSSGWQAPEQIRNGRQTRSVDMFSLGCLLYFCITAGQHPFGDVLERDLNIDRGKPDLFPIEHFPEATNLFSRLLEQDPQKRPSAQELKVHPFFWLSEKRLSFLIAASERVEREDRDPSSVVLPALEAGVSIAADGPWNEKLDADLLCDINRYRQYNFNTARDLLRVIRNKVNHYRELPPHVQQMVGSIPQGFERYFRVRFPKLLMEVYNVLKQQCSGEEMFKRYFTEESEF